MLRRDLSVGGELTAGRAPVLALMALLTIGCASSGAAYDTLRADIDRSVRIDAVSPADQERLLRAAVLERREFVRMVLERNPSIDAARQGWRAAVARVRQSGVVDDPMVNLELAPLSFSSSSGRVGYTAAVSQRLPWPGKLGFDQAVAKAEADAARSDFESTRRELALAAALLYDAYFASTRSLEVNAHHVALLRDLKAAALAQLETGRGSVQDPLQAEAELTHMEHDALILASERDVTVAQMNEFLHRDPSLPLPPPTQELELPKAPDANDGERLGGRAASARPEIESVRHHAEAEEARAARAERESYPDITVSTSYNSMWDMPEHRWMVGVGLNVPLQLGRRRGAVEEAQAARARFDAEAARMTDKARTEVVVALKRLEEAHHVVRLFEERLLPVARDQVDAARAGFVASRNDFAAVISAEKNLRSVELEFQLARANFDRRDAELERALGRVPGLGPRGAGR